MAHAYTSRRKTGRRSGAPARKMGTWKLAYADFLTALCAFFLVMWIVHGVSEDDKATLAQQFGGDSEMTELAATPDPAMQAKTVANLLLADPALKSFSSSVTITAAPDIVRIELSDMATRPLFETGDGRFNDTGRTLTEIAGQAIAILPFNILIEGHTDSNPVTKPGYSNWELSSDRANSARKILIESGVNADRIRAVSGLADTRPLLQQSPHLPANRRISIVLVINDKTA